MFVSAKHILLGTAVLLLSLPAMAAEENNLAVAAPPSHALVSCPGMSSVPMTADAEQALPLRLVANLTCGGDVAILSDNQATPRSCAPAMARRATSRACICSWARVPPTPACLPIRWLLPR